MSPTPEEVTRAVGIAALIFGSISAIILIGKAATEAIQEESALALGFLASGGIILGLVIVSDSEVILGFAIGLFVTAFVAGLILLLKALDDGVNTLGSAVLAATLIGTLIVGFSLMEVLELREAEESSSEDPISALPDAPGVRTEPPILSSSSVSNGFSNASASNHPRTLTPYFSGSLPGRNSRSSTTHYSTLKLANADRTYFAYPNGWSARRNASAQPRRVRAA